MGGNRLQEIEDLRQQQGIRKFYKLVINSRKEFKPNTNGGSDTDGTLLTDNKKIL